MRFLAVLYEIVRWWLGENPMAPEVRVSLTDIASRSRQTGCYYLMIFADDVEAAKAAGANYDVDFWFERGYLSRVNTEGTTKRGWTTR